MATLREWLSFDYEAGWGTDAFEENVPEGTRFPSRWTEADDRYDAADILRDNLELLDEITGQRLRLLRNGYRLGELVVDQAGPQGLAFRVALHNGTDGHNVPTGFDAERLVWLEVTVTDAAGKPVFRSGDLDPNGDVRDSHSVYVHNDDLPEDRQLFSLQSRFLVRMVRGGEREQVLAIPYSPSPLVFLRPSTHSSILTGRPADARKHRRTIPPRGTKWASYVVRREALEGTTGPYLATIRLKAAMVPVNLVHEVADVGFDYGMTERQVADAVVAGHLTLAGTNRQPERRRGGSGTPTRPGAHPGGFTRGWRRAGAALRKPAFGRVPSSPTRFLPQTPETAAGTRPPVPGHRTDRARVHRPRRRGVAPLVPRVRDAPERGGPLR